MTRVPAGVKRVQLSWRILRKDGSILEEGVNRQPLSAALNRLIVGVAPLGNWMYKYDRVPKETFTIEIWKDPE